MPIKKHLPIALGATIFSLSLAACNSEPVQLPTPEQQTVLDKLHKRCSAASLGENGHLKHLAVHRNRLGLTFTCDELKQSCEENYIGNACMSMRIVTTVENAHETACRSGGWTSSSCKTLEACNSQGFASEACQTAAGRFIQ
ncbi:MAG: hypothetical protein ABJG15_14740 [Hyphomonadaceae bacterium]